MVIDCYSEQLKNKRNRPMSMLDSPYHLFINDFQSRFHTIKKVDDLFSRGYVLALDYQTNKRAILKYYAIETGDQEQAVLQNMSNFQKLNQISGICKLLAYAISENKTQLLSAFEYDPLSLGEFVEKIKEINLDKYRRLSIYLDIMQQILKIISKSVEIGVELDDINRQTIIIQQNPKYVPQQHQEISFSSGNEQQFDSESMYICSILYDEREKQYNKIQNNQYVMSNGNKIYWSVQKIENHVFRGNEFCTEYGQESVYQLGLLMLDIVYDIEKHSRVTGSTKTIISGVSEEQELKTDEIAVYSQSRVSYYSTDKQNKSVNRNQILISHRLNFLMSSDFQSLRQFGVMVKNMVLLMVESRTTLSNVINDNKKIKVNIKRDIQNAKERMRQSGQQIIRLTNKEVKVKDQDRTEALQKNMYKKPTQSFKSLEEISEEPVNLQGGGTSKNISIPQNNQIQSDLNMNSSKQSDSSVNQNHAAEGLPTNLSPFPEKEVVLVQSQRSTGKTENLKNQNANINDDCLVEKNKNSYCNLQNIELIGVAQGKVDSMKNLKSNINGQEIGRQSMQQSEIDLTYGEQFLNFSKNHSEQLKNSFNSAIYEVNQIKKQRPEIVIRKEYFDGSVYYGCIDLSSKKRFGLGVYMYKSGDAYFGVWKDNTLSNGTYLFKNGESFEGTIKEGKQGLGIYRYNNGNVYNGMWKDDLKNGRGVMTYPNGAKYQGEWQKGKKHGEGTYFYESGIVYHGGFNLGKKYGNGVFQFPNGTRLEGFWDNNHIEGLVRVYYHNGDYYEGNFHMSQKSGEGIYKWSEQEQEGGIQYKGEFKKDNLEGFAIVKFRNGEIYEGKVKNGKRNGQGSYKYSNGDQFKGEWKNDEKQIGKYAFNSGDEFEGKFKDGQMTFGTLKYVNGQIYQGQFSKGYRHGVGTYSNKVGQLVHEGYWEKDEFMVNNKN